MPETKSKKSGSKTSGTASTKRVRKAGAGSKTSRKAPAKSRQTKVLSGEIQGIILIALGLFLACAFYISAAGIIGGFIKNVCYGLFGAASSIFFVFFLLAGVNCFLDKKRNESLYKWWVLLGLMLCSGMIYALVMKDTSFTGGGFTANLDNLYQNGINGNGGGILSGLLCKVLVLLIGYTGTWIFSLAAALTLLIILTGLSLEGVSRKFLNYCRKIRSSIANRIGSEVELEPINDAPGENKKTSLFKLLAARSKAKKEKKQKARAEKMRERESRAPIYNDAADTKAPAQETDMRDGELEVKPQRFVIEEDDSLTQSFRSSAKEAGEHRFKIDDLPFDIEEISIGAIAEENKNGAAEDALLDTTKTGALTDMPLEDGTIPKNDPDDFEPPSEAKLRDRLDPMTKKALDSGVPLDEAVTKGRKMSVEQEPSPEDAIAAEIEEHKQQPPIILYKMPPIELLSQPPVRVKSKTEIKQELEEKANKLLDTLSSFKVEAKIINITQGPTVTRFELQPGFGVKVSKITGLSDDIALSLAAPGVRIEAPIPGKSAIGIEIPNSKPLPVHIREVIDTKEFSRKRSKTTVALGKDISGSCVIADIADFPHILIAGATGAGKSVCINSLITSILYKSKPDEVKMIMVDPKMVELGVYNGIPHLLIPVVTDPKHAAGALNWAVVEMQNRYNLLKDNKVRNLSGFNKLMEEQGTPELKLPEIVIIIDELADLMNVAKSEVEEAINRLAALARAAGMYLVIATQRPSVNVITGVIKANIPSRIAFAVSSQVDSRTIIDSAGAEKLLGKGDMLYSPRGAMKPIRVQGNFVSDAEIEALVSFIKSQYEAEYDEEVIEHIEKEHERVAADIEQSSAHTAHSAGAEKLDDMFIEAAELVLENGQASVAMFQRKFKMGYQRAAKLIDQMEQMKIIGPYEGTKPRQVLITRQELNEMKYNRGGE